MKKEKTKTLVIYAMDGSKKQFVLPEAKAFELQEHYVFNLGLDAEIL